MKYPTKILIVLAFFTLFSANKVKSQTQEAIVLADYVVIPNNEKLVIVWTSSDREVAQKWCLCIP